MLGRRLVQAEAQERTQRQRVGGPPGDPALGVLALEVPDQEQPEVAARQETGAADRRRVERGALRFHERVEPLGVERAIQRQVERMPR